MKAIIRSTCLVIFSLFVFSFMWFHSNTWQIAPAHEVAFESDNPSGVFKNIDGQIHFDENNLSNSYFDLKVAVESINTGNGIKNKHAISPDWFHADKYPYIHFKSVKIIRTNQGFEALGNLKIKSISKAIRIPFRFNQSTFHASFTVNRLDYGVGSAEGRAKEAAEKITVHVSLPVHQ